MGPLGWRRSIGAATCGLLLATTGVAEAQRVALVRPTSTDPLLVDAFNRLRAELRIHHFEEQVVEPDPRESTADAARVGALARVAQSTDALASIAMVQDESTTSVQVWLVDRVSGKTTMRTVEIARSGDAASLLAIRAVDLLRTSLREFDVGKRPPPDVVGVDRRPVPQVVEALTSTPSPSFTLRVEGLALDDRPSLGFAYGLALGLSYRVAETIDLGLLLAGPLVEASWSARRGSASVTQELGVAEMRVAFFRSPRFAAGMNLGAGAYFLQAQGQATPPLVSVSDQIAGGVGFIGMHGQLNFSSRIGLTASVRAFGLAPQAGVALLDDTTAIAQPLLGASLGMSVGL